MNPSQQRPTAVERPRLAPIWCLTFLAFCLLYGLTAQRGVSWQDSGCFQNRVLFGYWHTEGGLALDHPLYIAAGRALLRLPMGSFFWRLNAFSGLGMAVALANLAALVLRLTGRRWVALATAAMLGVCHTPWWLATIAEIYTWVVAGLTAELWLLVSLVERPRGRTLAALALVSGLGWSLHNQALLPLPVYGVVVVWLGAQRRLSGKAMLAAAVAYLLGAGLYIGFIVERALAEGSLVAALRSALFANFRNSVLSLSPSLDHLSINLVLGGLNLVSLLLPLAVWGLWRGRGALGRPLTLALGAVGAIEFLFVLRYDVPDQFSFLLPTLLVLAVWAGLGLAAVAERAPRLALALALISVVVPPLAYGLVPQVARRVSVPIIRARGLPYRDEVRYWAVPWKHNEDSAERFTREALATASPNGIIVADLTTICALRAQQAQNGLAPGVEVWYIARWQTLWEWGKGEDDPYRIAEEHPIYIVSPAIGYAPESLLEHADLEPTGGLYRAYPRPGERPPPKRGKNP